MGLNFRLTPPPPTNAATRVPIARLIRFIKLRSLPGSRPVTFNFATLLTVDTPCLFCEFLIFIRKVSTQLSRATLLGYVFFFFFSYAEIIRVGCVSPVLHSVWREWVKKINQQQIEIEFLALMPCKYGRVCFARVQRQRLVIVIYFPSVWVLWKPRIAHVSPRYFMRRHRSVKFRCVNVSIKFTYDNRIILKIS